jgi:hypothetical protein
MRSPLGLLLDAFRRGGILGLLLLPALVHAGVNPPAASLHRLSAGLDAKGVTTDLAGLDQSNFRAGAYTSYSVTSALSLAGTVEHGFKEDHTLGALGMRFLLGRLGQGQVGAGLNWVGEEGIEPEWSASIHGSFPVAWARSGAALLWGIASAEVQPERDLSTYRLGLRWQLFGGRPWDQPVVAP